MEDVYPFVPFVGFPYAVREELKRSGDMTTMEAAKAGLGLGFSGGIGFIISYEVLGDRILTPMQVKLMREVWTKGPAVAAVATAAVAVTAASVAYEKKVSAPIRQGRQGVYFGPYASGFGSVV